MIKKDYIILNQFSHPTTFQKRVQVFYLKNIYIYLKKILFFLIPRDFLVDFFYFFKCFLFVYHESLRYIPDYGADNYEYILCVINLITKNELYC